METFFTYIKNHKKMVLSLIIVLFIIVPILPFIKSPCGIFNHESATIFLQYYGTILAGISGGFITLLGVWWTINDQKKQRKEEFELQYRSILSLKQNPEKSSELIAKNFLQFNFELFNYGNTEAVSLEIRMKNPNSEIISHNYIHRDILLPNESIEFTFSDYNNFYSPLGAQLTWYIEISYKNLFESIYTATFDVRPQMINPEEFKELDDAFSIEKIKNQTIKIANFSAEIINNSIKKIILNNKNLF